ncbi:MAG: hypothetical protein JWO67_2269 [Streptosporangiaceae bacterium]|nr:hypothetical protein [Streptosporangiaceae bacterium]
MTTPNDLGRAEFEHVPPDMKALHAMRRMGALSRLVSRRARVRLTNPHSPGHGWTGRIVGLADHPTILIELDNGKRHALPQAFEVEELVDNDAPRVEGDRVICSRCQLPYGPDHNCFLPGRPVKVLYLDLDSTVRKGYSELGRYVNDPADVEVFPAAIQQMRRWKETGGRIVGVTNQGGIALGIVTWQQVAAAIDETNRQTGHLFDQISVCSHHPEAKHPEVAHCWCRKPSLGAVATASANLARRFPNECYPPSFALMVGDRPEDRQCAEAAGLDFMWATNWRQDTRCPRCGSHTPNLQAEGEVQLCPHPWHNVTATPVPAVAK